ncbi:signal peptidase I [Candidatus Woesearchaeota archaeon]|nr:signal peptidase I [Candidatus Woesearchaeota archaeon]
MNKKNSKLNIVIFVLLIFIFGWFSNNVYTLLTDLNKEKPFSLASNEIKSPSDWIDEKQVKIRDRYVSLIIRNATWAKFTDTNSMDPVIDSESHAIKLMPSDTSGLNPGDIISFRSTKMKGIIIHRIVEKNTDEDGVYFITKGDNNRYPDSEKVRFEQITGVVVGILY